MKDRVDRGLNKTLFLSDKNSVKKKQVRSTSIRQYLIYFQYIRSYRGATEKGGREMRVGTDDQKRTEHRRVEVDNLGHEPDEQRTSNLRKVVTTGGSDLCP